VHFWLPGTVVSTGLRFVPKEKLHSSAHDIRPYLPVIRELSKELEKYPDAELVDVRDGHDHVRVSMTDGKLRIDATSQNGDDVHVSVPARVLRDVADQLEDQAPGV